jgi:predicted nucleotidyltransferase component of viral defense system
MDILKRHEQFEIEVLEGMKNSRFLDPLVFGGGTMLRLCYELNRYSADLDFWFAKKIKPAAYFRNLKHFLSAEYDVTDAQIKYYTLLFEIRNRNYPKRLKIEIRKEKKAGGFQERIAFSPYSSKQVMLRVYTIEEMMKNKVAAALDRREIRDFFDMEFLIKRGAPLDVSSRQRAALRSVISTFTKRDFSVTLGAFLDPATRKFYVENGFALLLEKIGNIAPST